MSAVLALAEEILTAATAGDWERASELAATRDHLVRQLVSDADGPMLEQLIDSDAQLQDDIALIQRQTAADIAKLNDGKRAIGAYRASVR